MRSSSMFLDDLLPPTSVRLGRLVLNSKTPHQDFFDPLDSRPTEAEYSVNNQNNFEETRKFCKSSKFRSYLTDILSISYGAKNEGTTSLTSPQVTTHRLENSGAWFGEACARPETRKWLQSAIDRRKRIYLVVGFRIIEDARLARNVIWSTAKGVGVEMPLTHLPISNMDSGARGLLNTSHSQRSVFDAPGKQIFAIQYRKVKFKWLSSRMLETTILENTQWKSLVDDWRGTDDDCEEDDDGEDDILEVNLTDMSDLEISDEESSTEDEMAHTALYHIS